MIFKFGSFTIDQSKFSVMKNQDLLELEPKIFKLLCFFCQHPERAISREELIESVWQGRIVSNAAINRAIGELRKVLEEDIKKPKIITTVSKVGYKFDVKVEMISTATKSDFKAVTKNKNTTYTKLYFGLASLFLVITTLFLLQSPNEKISNPIKITNSKPLTTIKGSAFKQQVYKNGDIAFLYKSQPHENVQIWSQKSQASPVQVTNDTYYYTYVIFKNKETLIASRFDNLEDRNCEIIQINLTNNTQTKISDCAQRAMTYLAFDSKLNKLYFNDRDKVSEPYSIKSLQVETRRVQQITHARPEGNTRGDYIFALSPDAENLAVLEYQKEGDVLLKVIRLDEATEVEKYENFSDVTGITWLTSNEIIISDGQGLALYNLHDKSKEYLLKDDRLTQATYSFEQSTLSYVRFDATQNIYAQKKDNQNVFTTSALTQSQFLNYFPTYSNTTNSLVYLSDDSGELAFYLIDDKSNKSKLEFPETIKHFSNIKWAIDDSYIITSLNSKLFMYKFAQNKWQEVPTNLDNIHHVEIIDNNNFIVSSDQSGAWQLWKFNLQTGTTSQLTTLGGYSSNYIESSHSLLISKFSIDGLFLLNLTDQSETVFLEDFKITDWNKWQIRNEHLYTLNKNTIDRTNIFTGDKSIFKNFDQRVFNYFSLNYDESSFSYAITEQSKSSIWYSKVIN